MHSEAMSNYRWFGMVYPSSPFQFLRVSMQGVHPEESMPCGQSPQKKSGYIFGSP